MGMEVMLHAWHVMGSRVRMPLLALKMFLENVKRVLTGSRRESSHSDPWGRKQRTACFGEGE